MKGPRVAPRVGAGEVRPLELRAGEMQPGVLLVPRETPRLLGSALSPAGHMPPMHQTRSYALRMIRFLVAVAIACARATRAAPGRAVDHRLARSASDEIQL